MKLGNAGKANWHIKFECKRCGPYGRYRVTSLFAEYGNVTMFELLDHIGSTCARRQNPDTPLLELCQLRCPTLATITMPIKSERGDDLR
jgi:hypothetical protein